MLMHTSSSILSGTFSSPAKMIMMVMSAGYAKMTINGGLAKICVVKNSRKLQYQTSHQIIAWHHMLSKTEWWWWGHSVFTQICLHIPESRSEVRVKVVVEQRLDLHVYVRLKGNHVISRIVEKHQLFVWIKETCRIRRRVSSVWEGSVIMLACSTVHKFSC